MDDARRQLKSRVFRIAIVWLAMLMLGSFIYSARLMSQPVTMTVVPEVPKEGEPVVVTFRLRNPFLKPMTTDYEFFANGRLLKAGRTTLAPFSIKKHQYAYSNPLPMGEQVHFVVRALSEQGRYEKAISLPSYPPQIWSSFVSFASFSTSVMSFMTTMTYYEDSFGASRGWNVGLVVSVVLILLLVYIELSEPPLRPRRLGVLGRLRMRFSRLSTLLFIIFMGMLYAKVLMTLTA